MFQQLLNFMLAISLELQLQFETVAQAVNVKPDNSLADYIYRCEVFRKNVVTNDRRTEQLVKRFDDTLQTL